MAAGALRKREVAQLVIVVLEAQNLDEQLAAADLYCVCDLSNSARGETSTRRGHEPVWDKEFRMKVYEVEGDRPLLKVALMQARDGEDELLGQGYVAIDGKWKNHEFDDWIDLKLNGRYTGQLFLEMTYYPAHLTSAPVQRRPSKLDKRSGAPFRLPLPADNPSGRFNPTPRPRIQQMHESGPLAHPATTARQPSVPNQGIKPQSFVSHPAVQPQPAPIKKPAALPLPGDPEPPDIPAFLRPGRSTAQVRPADSTTSSPQQQPQHHSEPDRRPPSSFVQHSPAPHMPLHYAANSSAEVSQLPPIAHSQSDPRFSTQQGTLAPHQLSRQQAHSMPLAEVRPAPTSSPHGSRPQQEWIQQQSQGERRRTGPTGQAGQNSHSPVSVLGSMTSGHAPVPSNFTEAPLPYHEPYQVPPHFQQQPPPQIQVQTTGATHPAVIPHGPYSPEQPSQLPRAQVHGSFPVGLHQQSPAQPYQAQQPSPSPPVADSSRPPSFVPPAAPSSPYRPPPTSVSQHSPQQHLQTQQMPSRRFPSPELVDSVPMPGSFDAAPPPRPPKTPLAPPLPPPPAPRSPSPPPTPPRRLRDHTPPRAAAPPVQIQQGRTKLEEYEREREVERERRRVEERERAQAEERDEDDDRLHDAELPPPIYSTKPPPTALDKGKGPARPESRDSTPIASTSASTNDSDTGDFSSSRIHAGQAALALRFQQEREDARMAAALARENDQREAAERKERERRADEEFARMMKEEERMREQREREDEELAKQMAEEGSGEEEARRARERADEELARSLAEAT